MRCAYTRDAAGRVLLKKKARFPFDTHFFGLAPSQVACGLEPRTISAPSMAQILPRNASPLRSSWINPRNQEKTLLRSGPMVLGLSDQVSQYDAKNTKGDASPARILLQRKLDSIIGRPRRPIHEWSRATHPRPKLKPHSGVIDESLYFFDGRWFRSRSLSGRSQG